MFDGSVCLLFPCNTVPAFVRFTVLFAVFSLLFVGHLTVRTFVALLALFTDFVFLFDCLFVRFVDSDAPRPFSAAMCVRC
jgi:hypothetical protein